MANRIVFEDNTVFSCVEGDSPCVCDYIDMNGAWKRINLAGGYESAAAKFVNGASFRHDWDAVMNETAKDENGNIVLDETGRPVITQTPIVQTEDLSGFNVAGDIIDHRDGTITVFMRKKTELELLRESFDELMIAYLGGN